MTRDSLALLLSGTFFGVLVGWIIGSQQAAPAPPPAPVVAQSAAPANTPAPPALDGARIARLEQQAKAAPADAAIRTEIGNLYFDGERFPQAIEWYGEALKLEPKNVNVSTDLAVAYYYTNQADLALKQLDYSLSIDPGHLKSLLNRGIVLAWGKEDLAGAQKTWERLVAIAPGSEEGKRAAQGLDGIRAAHGAASGAAPTAGASSP